MLENFFSFFEHFLQVISSRQVNLDAFMLNPKQARTDDKGRCEYWRRDNQQRLVKQPILGYSP